MVMLSSGKYGFTTEKDKYWLMGSSSFSLPISCAFNNDRPIAVFEIEAIGCIVFAVYFFYSDTSAYPNPSAYTMESEFAMATENPLI